MSSPRAILEVEVPGEESLLKEEITPAHGKDLTLRRLVFGSVFHEISANDAAEFGQFRVAGVATLTVQLRSQKVTEDAWVGVNWFTTTRSLAEHVEPFVDISDFKVTSAAPRIALIALEPLEWNLDEAEELRVRRSAAAVGFSLVVHRYSSATQSSIEQEIRTNPSSAVVIVGSGYGASRIRDEFSASSNSDRVIQLERVSSGDLLSSLREHFAFLGGIAPSLTLYPPFRPPRSGLKRARLPVSTPIKCFHDSFERPYVLDEATGEWWTRDTKGDGGSTFKRYRLEGEELIHVADVDADEKDMLSKHKGPTGKTIATADLHGCSHPESHLE